MIRRGPPDTAPGFEDLAQYGGEALGVVGEAAVPAEREVAGADRRTSVRTGRAAVLPGAEHRRRSGPVRGRRTGGTQPSSAVSMAVMRLPSASSPSTDQIMTPPRPWDCAQSVFWVMEISSS